MFESQLIKTDVTVVKFVDNYIFAGIGNFLNIFDEEGNFIEKKKIFIGQNVHGIEAADETIFLYGGCHMQLLYCHFQPLTLTTLYEERAKDWILATQWLKNSFLALVVMNNKVIIYSQDLNVVREIVCGQRCILYSASIVYDHLNELVILSGTVFGEVLIWKFYQNDDKVVSPVLTELKGHKGVIFSVSYNSNSGYICSTSDDRCSILWFVENKCLHEELKQKVPKISLLRKLYGHQSRIFRALVLHNVLVTAGEDSLVNVWDFEGDLLRKIETHQGGPVWALDCKNDMVIVGGGSSGILKFLIQYNPDCRRLILPDNHIPRRIGILRSENLIVVTEGGTLYYYTQVKEQWSKCGQHQDLQSYNIVEISSCRSLFSISGYHGEIYIYKEKNNYVELLVAHRTKDCGRIGSFHWLSCKTFLTCEEGGKLSLWFLNNNDVILVTIFLLPEGKKQMWSTTACQGDNGRYVIGDRRGNIYIYALKTKCPIQIFKKAHNHLGVTYLQIIDDRLVSLGRDGTVKTFVMTLEGLELISTDKVPFTWLAAMTNNILLAFSGKKFIVWDYKARRTLLEHVCGGGHRSWDFFKNKTGITLGFVKDRAVNILKCDEKLFQSPTVVSDYHVNVINSLCVVTFFENRFLLVSGSEDTNLRVTQVGKDYFLPLNNYKSHLSSIRAMCVHSLSNKSYLVFSGGGRGQIICWKYLLDVDNVRKSEFSQQYSYYEPAKEQMLESEIRIMDMQIIETESNLLLFAASSDGNIKVFRVNHRTNKYTFYFLSNLFNTVKSVSKLQVLKVGLFGRYILVSSSSDGFFTFWDVSSFEDNKQIEPFTTMKIHQSGITSLCVHFIGDNSVVLLSGGDDCCFVLTLFEVVLVDENLQFFCRGQFRDASSHCAQVTGVWMGSRYFLTTSIDQKLLLFEWNVDQNDKICCLLLSRYDSALSDIQGMVCSENCHSFNVFLFGKGVEYVTVKKEFF